MTSDPDVECHRHLFIRNAGYNHQFHYCDVTYFSLTWCDIISITVMWHTFHCRGVTYFSLPWCDIFELPWCDILFTTVMWYTFHYRDVACFSLPWCDILSTTGKWHTFNCQDVTYFQLMWCDILSTTGMWHIFHCRDVTYCRKSVFSSCGIDSKSNCPIIHNDWHDITKIDVICLIDIITQWNENVWQTKVRLRRVITNAKF